MPYVAGRHQMYNGKVYERGEVMDLSDATLSRIESYTYTKTIVWSDDTPTPEKRKPGRPKKVVEPVIEALVEEAPVVEAPVVEETVETVAE